MREKESENEKGEEKPHDCDSLSLWALPSNLFSSWARNQGKKINISCIWEAIAGTKCIF